MSGFGSVLPRSGAPSAPNLFIQRRAAVHALFWALNDDPGRASEYRDADILAGQALASVLAQDVSNASGIVWRLMSDWLGPNKKTLLQEWVDRAKEDPEAAAAFFVFRIREDYGDTEMKSAATRDAADSAFPLNRDVPIQRADDALRLLGQLLRQLLDVVTETTGDPLTDARTDQPNYFKVATLTLKQKWLYQEPETRQAAIFHEAWTLAAALGIMARGLTGVLADFQRDAIRVLVHQTCAAAGRIQDAEGPLAPDFLDNSSQDVPSDPVEAALAKLSATAQETDPRVIVSVLEEVVPRLAPLRDVDSRVIRYPADLMTACRRLGELTGVSWVGLQGAAQRQELSTFPKLPAYFAENP